MGRHLPRRIPKKSTGWYEGNAKGGGGARSKKSSTSFPTKQMKPSSGKPKSEVILLETGPIGNLLKKVRIMTPNRKRKRSSLGSVGETWESRARGARRTPCYEQPADAESSKERGGPGGWRREKSNICYCLGRGRKKKKLSTGGRTLHSPRENIREKSSE